MLYYLQILTSAQLDLYATELQIASTLLAVSNVNVNRDLFRAMMKFVKVDFLVPVSLTVAISMFIIRH